METNGCQRYLALVAAVITIVTFVLLDAPTISSIWEDSDMSCLAYVGLPWLYPLVNAIETAEKIYEEGGWYLSLVLAAVSLSLTLWLLPFEISDNLFVYLLAQAPVILFLLFWLYFAVVGLVAHVEAATIIDHLWMWTYPEIGSSEILQRAKESGGRAAYVRVQVPFVLFQLLILLVMHRRYGSDKIADWAIFCWKEIVAAFKEDKHWHFYVLLLFLLALAVPLQWARYALLVIGEALFL